MKTAYKIFVSNRELIDSNDTIDPELIPEMFGIHSSLETEQLMVLAAIVKNDSFMDNPLLFEDTVLVLNGISPNILQMEGCSPEQIWYAVYIMSLLRPDLEFSNTVKEYIKFIHAEEGFLLYPKESGIKTPLKEQLISILSKKDKELFEDFDLEDKQASKLVEVIDYIQTKIKEDQTV